MTSWHGHAFRIPCHFWRDSTGVIAICAENQSVADEFDYPHKGPVKRTFYVVLLLVWTSCWTYNRARDLGRHGAHIVWRHCNETVSPHLVAAFTPDSYPCAITVTSGCEQREVLWSLLCNSGVAVVRHDSHEIVASITNLGTCITRAI